MHVSGERQSAEQVAAEAEAAMPEEPAEGAPGACVLAVRTPSPSLRATSTIVDAAERDPHGCCFALFPAKAAI